METLKAITKDKLEFPIVISKLPSEVIVEIIGKMKRESKLNKTGKLKYIVTYDFNKLRCVNIGEKRIRKVFDELLTTKVRFLKNGHYKKVDLFLKYSFVNKTTVELIMSRNSIVSELMTQENYTIIEDITYSKLNSKYSKEFYRILSQFENEKKLVVKKEDLFEVLNVPKTYDDLMVLMNIMNPVGEDLKKYFNEFTLSNFETNSTGEMPEICEFIFNKKEREEWGIIFKKKSKSEIEIYKHIMKGSE